MKKKIKENLSNKANVNLYLKSKGYKNEQELINEILLEMNYLEKLSQDISAFGKLNNNQKDVILKKALTMYASTQKDLDDSTLESMGSRAYCSAMYAICSVNCFRDAGCLVRCFLDYLACLIDREEPQYE
ncbi:hypothetical protein [Thermoflexibacter ruber]|uniref:Uncharacterized protein n=1 Tax=Thermoflexibacter ruber TaxID=1003 RepID=A0A1I2JHB8_9BACT|nr:hypothetical protein [Thermoflexibacter ruber]SFF53243.1 hypothetical protein SAMN04488541_10509 [Thermoflexibacter ruber]